MTVAVPTSLAGSGVSDAIAATDGRADAATFALDPDRTAIRRPRRGGFGLVTVITGLTAIGSALYARDASSRREQILAAYATDLTSAYEAQLSAERMVAIGRGYLLTPDPSALERFHDTEARLETSLEALEHADVSTRERALLAQAKRSAVHYRTMFDDVIEAPEGSGEARSMMLRDR